MGLEPTRLAALVSETSMCYHFITSAVTHNLVPEVGLEPTRLSAGDFKSPVYYQFHHSGISKFGALGETRTHNPFGTGFLDQRVYHSTTNA